MMLTALRKQCGLSLRDFLLITKKYRLVHFLTEQYELLHYYVNDYIISDMIRYIEEQGSNANKCFVLTDQVVDAAINAISGYIVSTTAEESGKSIEDVIETFLDSNTYSLLSDAETGYYWDSLDELINMFKNECKTLV